MRIRAGEFNHHFYIDAAPEILSPGGQLYLDWDNATTVRRWGKFVPRWDRQWLLAQQQFGEVRWLLDIRGRLEVTPRMRVRTNETPERTLEIMGSWQDREEDGNYRIYIACREQPAVAVANAEAQA